MLTAEEIKKIYLSGGMDKFELFRTEIIGLARQIKIWLAIAQAKEKFKKLKNEDFWGWIQQYSALRLVAIDGLKIAEGMTYIKSVIREIVTSDQCMSLIKNSQLSNRLKVIRELIEPLKTWRNKRYAHLENTEIEIVKCNLQDFLISLVNLDISLGYISHYL